MKQKRGYIFILALLAFSWAMVACQSAPAEPAPVEQAQGVVEPAAVPATDPPAETAIETAVDREAENLALVRRFYDEYAAGNAAVILELHPETITMHYAGSSEEVPAQLLYEDLAALKAANPDVHAEVHHMAAAGDYVLTELTWMGTQSGEFFGIPATGNPVLHNGIVMRRLVEGKIVESWEIWDDLAFLNSLGLAPSWDDVLANPGTAVVPMPPEATQHEATLRGETAEEQQNLAITQRFYDEYAAGNAAVILELHPETITMHYAGSSDAVPAQVLYEDLAALKAANPDVHAEIHTMIAAGDYVFTELTWRGTHTGEFFGLPATGNPITHNGIVVRRLADDKIVESWEMWDDLAFFNSLGLLPSWDELIANPMAEATSIPVPQISLETLAGVWVQYDENEGNNYLILNADGTYEGKFGPTLETAAHARQGGFTIAASIVTFTDANYCPAGEPYESHFVDADRISFGLQTSCGQYNGLLPQERAIWQRYEPPTAAASALPEVSLATLLGTWRQTDEESYNWLILAEDGTYEAKHGPAPETAILVISGNYTLTGNKLMLQDSAVCADGESYQAQFIGQQNIRFDLGDSTCNEQLLPLQPVWQRFQS